jgi:hypothetical protein
LLRDASDLALDRLSTHPAESFFGLLRRIVRNANAFNQIPKVTANLHLMNERIETLSRK